MLLVCYQCFLRCCCDIVQVLLLSYTCSSVVLSPVRTDDKVEFDTVESGSRPCCFGPIHSGNKRIGNKVDCDKMSNSRRCRFVAKTGNNVDRIGNIVDRICDSRLCCRFVAGFGNSRLSTKSTVLNSTLSSVSTELWTCCSVVLEAHTGVFVTGDQFLSSLWPCFD